MPDPRFDGSQDAPHFVDRGTCSDCGQPRSHRNHNSFNENGHFYNDGEKVLAEERVSSPEPKPIEWLDAAVKKDTKAIAQAAPVRELQPAQPRIPVKDEAPPPLVCAECGGPRKKGSAKKCRDCYKKGGGIPQQKVREPWVPSAEWKPSIAAAWAEREGNTYSSKLCAAVLRHAPEPATVVQIGRIIEIGYGQPMTGASIYSGLYTLKNRGEAVSEGKLMRDAAGHQRRQALWSATEKLRAAEPVTKQAPAETPAIVPEPVREIAPEPRTSSYTQTLQSLRIKRQKLVIEVTELEHLIDGLERFIERESL